MTSNDHNKLLRILRLIQYLTSHPPKDAKKIENLLEVSTATVYRYFNVLRDIGYQVDCDNQKRYFIEETESHRKLTKEEKKHIAATLQANPKPDLLAKSILHKLQTEENLPDPVNLAALHRIKMLNNIQKAIQGKVPLKIVKYNSSEAGTSPADRRIIPYQINEYNMSVTAWDMDRNAFRIFKVYRMDDIEILELSQTSVHAVPPPDLDIFGMAGYEYTEISLLLTVRASSILKEEFHRAQIFISDHKDTAGFPFRLDIKVCGYEGIGRFVLGLLAEIIILGDEGFKTYVKSKLNSMTILTN